MYKSKRPATTPDGKRTNTRRQRTATATAAPTPSTASSSAAAAATEQPRATEATVTPAGAKRRKVNNRADTITMANLIKALETAREANALSKSTAPQVERLMAGLKIVGPGAANQAEKVKMRTALRKIYREEVLGK